MSEFVEEVAKATRKCRGEGCGRPIVKGETCFVEEVNTDFGKAKQSICKECAAKR